MATAESFKFAGILGAALEQHHLLGFEISSVQLLSRVRLFAAPWTAALQASLSITNSHSLLKFMSTESVMPSNHLTLCHITTYQHDGGETASAFRK